MKRRRFLQLGGAAVAACVTAAPRAVQAQRRDTLRRIGVHMTNAAEDPEGQARVVAFVQTLQKLGWTEGRNIRIDIRWGSVGNVELQRRHAQELVALAPEVIIASTTISTLAVQQVTRTIPIVFSMTLDPVGSGIVESIARPGGNTTGFMQFEYSLSGKWLELLKQIAPNVTRAAVFREPTVIAGIGQFAVIQGAASPLGIEVIPINVRNPAEIERSVEAFVRIPNGGIVVTGGPATIHRKQIIALAAKHRLPAVYPYRFYVLDGGLVCYGPDLLDQFRGAAGYVDRILKGAKPADLPVQAPNKYQTVLNLRTAKTMGLAVPPSVLARADEVIE